MYYTSKLRVIVCSSLENTAHPARLSHRTPQPERWLSKCHFKTKQNKKKSQRAEGRVEGCRGAAAWGDSKHTSAVRPHRPSREICPRTQRRR